MSDHVLTLYGREVERHPHRLTCIIAAFERGWATVGNHVLALHPAVQIATTPNRSPLYRAAMENHDG